MIAETDVLYQALTSPEAFRDCYLDASMEQYPLSDLNDSDLAHTPSGGNVGNNHEMGLEQFPLPDLSSAEVTCIPASNTARLVARMRWDGDSIIYMFGVWDNLFSSSRVANSWEYKADEWVLYEIKRLHSIVLVSSLGTDISWV